MNPPSVPAARSATAPELPTASLPSSTRRFGDGGQYRVEIPSVEGPAVLATVLEESRRRGVPVHRVSQGSGIAMQTDDELREMVELGSRAGVEVCLFHARAAWDAGTQAVSSAGRVVAGALRGADQLRYAIDDVAHACSLGIRSVLVSDLGLLATLAQLRRAGDLPDDLVLKVSAALPVANPATAGVLVELGADTLNLVVDLPLAAIAAIRRAVDVPLDVYVEAPDDFGGVIRHHETAELVRLASPVYLKFGVRNSTPLYPSGTHLEDVAGRIAAERVRRAQIALGILHRHAPEAIASPVPARERAA
jgi:hypothetical protein